MMHSYKMDNKAHVQLRCTYWNKVKMVWFRNDTENNDDDDGGGQQTISELSLALLSLSTQQVKENRKPTSLYPSAQWCNKIKAIM